VGGVVSFDGDNPARRADESHERLQALYQLAIETSELRDLQQVLDLALRQCLALTGSQFGFIGLNAADSDAMDVVAVQGFEVSKRFYEQFHLLMPLRPRLLAHAALDNRPVRSLDAMSEENRVGQPRGHPPVHEFLGVPLRRRGLPMGMIGVANRAGAYLEEHEHLLLTYAAQVAIAIHNAHLYDELKAAKEELERVMLGQFTALRSAQVKEDVSLSDSDLQVLALVAAGASNADVSAALHWSLPSVKRKLHRICTQLGARSRAQATAEAVRRGVI